MSNKKNIFVTFCVFYLSFPARSNPWLIRWRAIRTSTRRSCWTFARNETSSWRLTRPWDLRTDPGPVQTSPNSWTIPNSWRWPRSTERAPPRLSAVGRYGKKSELFFPSENLIEYRFLAPRSELEVTWKSLKNVPLAVAINRLNQKERHMCTTLGRVESLLTDIDWTRC